MDLKFDDIFISMMKSYFILTLYTVVSLYYLAIAQITLELV